MSRKTVDYTGAKAKEYMESYVNRPEDAGTVEGLTGLINKMSYVTPAPAMKLLGLPLMAGRVSNFKNAFKLGKKGYDQAKDFLKMVSKMPRKKGNAEEYYKVKKLIERSHAIPDSEASLSRLSDMARARIALQNVVKKAKESQGTKKHKYYVQALNNKLKQYKYEWDK
tara:strand:- start:276 stop:779 length:504 start_codon:yes stop_codon:yes gene_type:complete